MKNPLAKLMQNRKVKSGQDLKERVLKNRTGVLDAIAENIEGARQCPMMIGQKCLGAMREIFHKYTTTTRDGKPFEYSICNINQTPRLIIENTNETRNLISEQKKTQALLAELIKKTGDSIKVEAENG